MKPTVTVISLGPGDPDLLNTKTLRVLRSAGSLILRTGRHPVSAWLEQQGIPYSTLDSFYDEADDFDELNRKIAAYVIGLASVSEVVYAVPDASMDLSVRAMFNQAPSSMISVVPGVGPVSQYLTASLPLLNGSMLAVSSAYDFLSGGYCDPNQTLLITELDNPILAGSVKLLLARVFGDEHPVFMIRGSSEPAHLPLYQLDRQKNIDHTSAVLIPGSSFLERERFVMRDLAALMETLRSPGGCPWDRAQTHASLEPYMIEEAWECVASIDQDDTDHLCEELGDLLFQVVFHASVGASFDEFTLYDIITGVCRKMIRRHPHVFGNREITDPGSVRTVWEQIKREETGHTSLTGSLDDVSEGLPSLKYAAKFLKKLSPASFAQRTPSEIISGIVSLCGKIGQDPSGADRHDLGLLLFFCTELCSRLDSDAELVLRQTAVRLKSSLKEAEKMIIRDGKTLEHLTFGELCVYLKHVEGEIE